MQCLYHMPGDTAVDLLESPVTPGSIFTVREHVTRQLPDIGTAGLSPRLLKIVGAANVPLARLHSVALHWAAPDHKGRYRHLKELLLPWSPRRSPVLLLM